MMKLSRLCCLIGSSLLLQACGGSDDSSSGGTPSPSITTSYAITVDAPPALITAKIPAFRLFDQAYADSVDNLAKDNFTVVIINADGEVIEEVTLSDEQWSREPDGSYVISLPGGQRLDCVILVDLNGTPTIQLNQPLPGNTLFAPTTSEAFQVDLSSTAAYQAVVEQIAATSSSGDDWGDFANAIGAEAENVEQAQELVEQVIEDIKEQIEQALENQQGEFELDDILEDQEVKDLVENVVDRIEKEIDAETIDIATLLNQGFWWIDAYEDDSNDEDVLRIETGKVSYDGTTSMESWYDWNSGSGEALNLDSPDGSTAFTLETADGSNLDIDAWVLSDDPENPWLNDYDSLLFRSASSDSAVLTSVGLEGDSSFDRNVSLREINIANAPIRAFAATPQTDDLVDLIPPAAVFSEQARAYLGSETTSKDIYSIYQWDNCDLPEGEFCNRSYINNSNDAPTSLDQLLSDSAAEDNNPNMHGVWLSGDGLLAELLNDAAKTVNLWQIDFQNQSTSKLDLSGSWSMQTISGQTLLMLELPAGVTAYGVERDELASFFTVVDGYVRRGQIAKGNSPESFYVFNQAAIEDLFAAFNQSSCDLQGIDSEMSEQQFTAFFGNCISLPSEQVLAELYQARLVRVNAAGETRAFEFNADNTFRYYNNGIANSSLSNWALNEDGFIRLDWSDTEYDLLVAASFSESQDLLKFGVFSNLDGSQEAWSMETLVVDKAEQLESCEDFDSDYDEQNEVPQAGTEKRFSDYETAISACAEAIGSRLLSFSEAVIKGKAIHPLGEDERNEYMMFTDQAGSQDGWFIGQFRNVDASSPEQIDFEWTIENGRLYLEASFEEDGKAITVKEYNTLTATNGKQFAAKYFSQQSNWTDDFSYMDSEEGEIWSDVFEIIGIAEVPALP